MKLVYAHAPLLTVLPVLTPPFSPEPGTIKPACQTCGRPASSTSISVLELPSVISSKWRFAVTTLVGLPVGGVKTPETSAGLGVVKMAGEVAVVVHRLVLMAP